MNDPKRLVLKDIHEKFENTIEQFLSDTFANIFLHDRFKYKRIKLYLVSDAYGEVGKYQNHAKYLAIRNKINKRDTLRVDMALSERPYKFRGKLLQIEYEIPSNPVIRRVQ